MSLVVGGWLSVSGRAGAVSFSFTTIGGDTLTGAQSAAFATAAAAWSAALTDPVSVQVGIGFRDLGTVNDAIILGATSSSLQVRAYNAFQVGLTADATSGTDTAAMAHLPVSVPSNQVLLTTAQARAAGLAAAATADGSREFTSYSGISYATTRAALTSGSYDLIGVAEHELGHLLGFDSSLDFGTSIRSVLDLFRYSAAGTQSFTTGEAAYFSVDGGVTNLGDFSVGGSGQYQASHWLQGTGALLDPAVSVGTAINIAPRDLVALDAAGWDVAVAEPTSAAVMLAGLGVLAFWRRRGELARVS
jgi:MYXO-CTERM domain-containing protein